MVHRAIIEGQTCCFFGFGHKETGKSYSVLGEPIFVDLHRLTTSENDQRGFVMRSLAQIKSHTGSLANANIEMSVFDVTLDSVRDILRYAQKVRKNANQDLDQMLQKHTGIQTSSHGSAVQAE